MFYSNSVVNKFQEKLAYELGETSGYPDYSAFVNSGAEANENALNWHRFILETLRRLSRVLSMAVRLLQ